MIAREFTNPSCRDFRAIVNLFTSWSGRNVTTCRNQHAMTRKHDRMAAMPVLLFLS